MTEISIPYHLIIPASGSLILFIFIIFNIRDIFKKGNWKLHWVSVIIFFSFYCLIVGLAAHEDISAQIVLNKFDLNGDGFFTPEEYSPELDEAMKRLISDTGRNFSFITGLIFSAIAALVFYTTAQSIRIVKKLIARAKSATY